MKAIVMVVVLVFIIFIAPWANKYILKIRQRLSAWISFRKPGSEVASCEILIVPLNG